MDQVDIDDDNIPPQVPNLESRMTQHTLKDVFCVVTVPVIGFQHLSTNFNHFQLHNWKLEYRLHHSSSPSQIQRNLDSGSLKLNRTPRPVASSVFGVYPYCSLSQVYLPRAKPSHQREMRLGLSRKSLALKQHHPKRAKARCSQRFQPIG